MADTHCTVSSHDSHWRELLSELFTKSSVSFFYCSLRWIHLLCVLLYFIGYSLFRVPSDHSPIPNSLLLHQLCFLIFSGQPDRQVAQHGRREARSSRRNRSTRRSGARPTARRRPRCAPWLSWSLWTGPHTSTEVKHNWSRTLLKWKTKKFKVFLPVRFQDDKSSNFLLPIFSLGCSCVSIRLRQCCFLCTEELKIRIGSYINDLF